MKGVLRYQLEGLRNAWHDGLRDEVRRSAIAFLLLAVLAFGACMLLILIPLLAAAALVETYITPVITSLLS